MNRFCMAPHGKLLTNFCLIWHIGDEKGLTQQSCFRSYVRRGRRNDLDFRWVGITVCSIERQSSITVLGIRRWATRLCNLGKPK